MQTPSQTPDSYSGEVVYMFAYDVAYEMRQPIPRLFGQPVSKFSVDPTKRSPKHLSFYQPQMVRLPQEQRVGPHGPVWVERVVKLLPIGAISITVRVPFTVSTIEQLIDYHDLQLGGSSLSEDVRLLAEQVRLELIPHSIRPVAHLADEEAYTVFCIQSPMREPHNPPFLMEQWLVVHRREIAALLNQESDVDGLSEQETLESTGRHLSYYKHDLVVVDWDAALIVDERSNFNQTLYVMELANLQLTELEAYDRMLDDALERSYRNLRAKSFFKQKGLIEMLRDIRIDLARFSDELSNITKFFGDWHVARVYQLMSLRFHLPAWHHMIDEKLNTLDQFYQLLNQNQTNRWMLILEATIVLLFIIDIIALFLGK